MKGVPKAGLTYPLNKSYILITKTFKAFEDYMASYSKIMEPNLEELSNIASIYQKWAKELSFHPNMLGQNSYSFWNDFTQNILTFINSQSDSHSQEDQKIKQDWQKTLPFCFYQQTYLLFTKHCLEFIENNPSKDHKLNQQVAFFSRRYFDALSPTNFILTNPQLLEKTYVSAGKNLYQGYQHFLEDYIKNKGHWQIKMTDTEAFAIGKNLAITPGKIIYQNTMMQLIQYEATTKKTYDRPLLIVPPWINKYYILDLSQKNSFVKWAVSQGFTVFMISWVNPDKDYQEVTFEDYLNKGFFEALEIIEKVTQQPSVNALGFCIGGTLLAIALGVMQAQNNNRIHSATFLTTLIDFSEPGEIGAFIDEAQITSLEKRMEKEGYLDGRLLMMTFNMLRANELFWPYYVNNYLAGNSPNPLDLLYWNCDSTHLPAKMHSFYLRKLYLENLLSKKQLTFNNVSLDLSQVNIPIYFLSAQKDHIAPWHSCFNSAKCLSGQITFVLSGSGHIAGVINPPAAKKYHFFYQENPWENFSNATDWLTHAQKQEGSWWGHWSNWLKQYSSKKIEARIPGTKNFGILEEAPGSYVKKRIN